MAIGMLFLSGNLFAQDDFLAGMPDELKEEFKDYSFDEIQCDTVDCGECQYTLCVFVRESCNGNIVINASASRIDSNENCLITLWPEMNISNLDDPNSWVIQPLPHFAWVNGLVSSGTTFEVTINFLDVHANAPGFGCTIPSTSFTVTDLPEGIHIHDQGSCGTEAVGYSDYIDVLNNAPSSFPVRISNNLLIDGPLTSSRDWLIRQGVRINTTSGGVTTFTNANLSSEGCCGLWYGLSVEEEGVLNIVDDTGITDAMYAIHALENSAGTIQVENSRLFENYIGLFTEKNSTVVSSFVENEISAPLHKPNCTECLPNPPWGFQTRGYAGIVAIESPPLNLNRRRNNFFELANGIRARDNALNLVYQEFEDISDVGFEYDGGTAVFWNDGGATNFMSDDPYLRMYRCDINWADVGVHAINTDGGGQVRITGHPFEQRANNFRQCWESIVLDARTGARSNGDWYIFRNFIWDMADARYLPRGTTHKGIVGLTQNNVPVSFRVTENDVQLEGQNALGIYLINGNAFSPSPSEVDNNIVSMLSGGYQRGIHTLNTRGAKINDNIIGQNSIQQADRQGELGIYVRGGTENVICSNDIDMYQNVGTRGIRIRNSTAVSVTGNTLVGGDRGISAEGTCVPGSIAQNVSNAAGHNDAAIRHVPPGVANVVGNQFFKQNAFLDPNDVEVNTGATAAGGDVYFIPNNFPANDPRLMDNSSFDHWIAQPGSSMNIQCGDNTGDAASPPPPGGPDLVVTDPDLAIEMSEGIYAMQSAAAFGYYNENGIHSEQQADFMQHASGEFAERYYELSQIFNTDDQSDAHTQAEIVLTGLEVSKDSYSQSQANMLQIMFEEDPDVTTLQDIASSCYEQNGHAVDWAAAKLASVSPSHDYIEGCEEIQARSNKDSGSKPVAMQSSLKLISNLDSRQLVFNEPLEEDFLQLYDVAGKPINVELNVSGNVVSLSALTPGLYILHNVDRGTSFRIFAH